MSFASEYQHLIEDLNLTYSQVQELDWKLEMLREEKRLSTFANWQIDSKNSCSARKMAEAGFVFTGSAAEPDSAVCFFCQKHLDCWEEDDDPWAEHLKHSKDCMFAKLGLPENQLTLKQFMEIKHKLFLDFVRKIFEKQREKINQQFDKAISMLTNH